MSNQINAKEQFPVGTWAILNDFPSIPEMRVVKVLENGWRGTRYLVSPSVIAYGEYHVDELFDLKDDPEYQKNLNEPESNTGILTNFQ